ncbi:MAG: galactose-1-phosphate uridylyltransferase [Alphaproteobacteria bacterium]
MREFRKDLITGRCTIISTDRAKRPQQLFRDNLSGEAEPCPFCPGNEHQTPPEVLAYRTPGTQPDAPGWSVRVVPNKYPAVVNDDPGASRSNGLYQSSRAAGVHEVIVETPDHVKLMARLGVQQIAAVLRAYHDRMSELKKDTRWRYVLIYKNQGATAGATLEHAHSQLIALPEIPPSVAEEINGARAYFSSMGRCVYCDIVQHELCDRKRLITESERFIVFCPYAARFPYETWILPKHHAPVFACTGGAECDELSRCLNEILMRLDRTLADPSLNYVLHSSPLGEPASVYYHWHFEVLPKVTQVAGFEWGSGSFINPVAPEEAARLMREVVL